jgi:hypothetical protein
MLSTGPLPGMNISYKMQFLLGGQALLFHAFKKPPPLLNHAC